METWYNGFFEPALKGRYLPLKTIEPLIESLPQRLKKSVLGTSEFGRPIYMIHFGSGSKKILMWSQMHGNESTTTKALFDFFNFVQTSEFQNEVNRMLSEYSFYIIPMLNPDGAEVYTRFNGNQIDLNRDAQILSQKESQVLRRAFEEISPSLCLNLHDQRTIFGINSGKPATISFLSPAADAKRTITLSREKAMAFIEKMNEALQKVIPNSVGRYDDSFNLNCVGDTFQNFDVPTILIEAGHFPGDYARDETRKYVCYALLALFDANPDGLGENYNMKYFDIPENEKNFRDIIIRNLCFDDNTKFDLAIQYEEELKGQDVIFAPIIDSFEEGLEYKGHKEILLNSPEFPSNLKKKLKIGTNIDKIADLDEHERFYFSKIVSELEKSN